MRVILSASPSMPRLKRLGLMGLLLFHSFSYSQCLSGDYGPLSDSGGPPAIVISGAPDYVEAFSPQCIDLELRMESPAWSPVPVILLKSDIGDLSNVSRVGRGVWSASLCPGPETGLVRFYAPGFEVQSESLYIIPPEDPAPEGPVTAGYFEAYVDPVLEWADFVMTDAENPYGIRLTAGLYTDIPFMFDGLTAGIAVIIEGDSLKVDITDIRARILSCSSPLVSLKNPDGRDDEGHPYFMYGDFLSMDTADNLWMPNIWGMFWYFQMEESRPFTISGEITVRLPEPRDHEASFTVRPYLTMVSDTGATLSWETDIESKTFVVYGSSPECGRIATGSVTRNIIDQGYDWSYPRVHNSIFHRVELTGLEPGTTVYYRVLAVAEPTQEIAFRTAPLPERSFSFAVIGDTQKDSIHHWNLIAGIYEYDPGFLVHVGDIVDVPEFMQWLDFFSTEGPVIERSPIFPTPGNHDQGGFDLYYRRFFHRPDPPGVSEELRGRMYSFDYAHAHFASIDTCHPWMPGTEQYEWLSADLAAAAADPEISFIFVFHHYPFLSAFEYVHDQNMIDALGSLYSQRGVDAVFSGHLHMYERCEYEGTVYLISGGAASYLHDHNPDPSFPYQVTWAREHHYIRVNVFDDRFEIIAVAEDGTEIDRATYFAR